MAKIRTRKRGKTYSYSFDAGLNANGKRKVVEKGGYATKKEAYEAGTKAFAAWKNGNIAIVSEKVTTGDFLDDWLTMKADEVRPKTIALYRTMSAHIKTAVGSIQLQTLCPRDIDTMMRNLAKTGKSKSTLVKILNITKVSLDYAVYPCELIQNNPASYVKVPKNAPKEVVPRRILTPTELSDLFTKFPFEHPFHIPIKIAYHTGMRLGEILGLCWDNVDLKNGKITVVRQINYTPATGYYFGAPKTETSKRTILVDGQLVALLKKWKAQQAKNEIAAGKMYVYCYEGDNGGLWHIPKGQAAPERMMRRPLVCTNGKGEKVNAHAIQRAFSRLGLNFHSLRHTHATMLMENHAMPKDVAARLGHSNASITQNLYTHDTEEMQKDTLAIFEQAISGK